MREAIQFNKNFTLDFVIQKKIRFQNFRLLIFFSLVILMCIYDTLVIIRTDFDDFMNKQKLESY